LKLWKNNKKKKEKEPFPFILIIFLMNVYDYLFKYIIIGDTSIPLYIFFQ
jgi:hypothetical protein